MMPLDDDPEQRTLWLVYSAPEPEDSREPSIAEILALVLVCVVIIAVIGFALSLAGAPPPL